MRIQRSRVTERKTSLNLFTSTHAQYHPAFYRHVDVGASLLLTGFLNFVFVSILSLVVLTPVTAIANYLFTEMWPVPFYIRIPALIPLLVVYLLPWSVYFGERWLLVVRSGTYALTLPLLVYWAMYRGLERDEDS